MGRLRTGYLVIFCILIVGFSGTVLIGNALRQEAQDGWEQEAASIAHSLSGTLLDWLEESYAPLSGLAALAANSAELTETEFLNAYDGLEARATAVFLEGAALASQSEGGDQQWEIRYSSDPQGVLKPKAQLDSSNLGLGDGAKVALDRFGEIVLGVPFDGDDQEHTVAPILLSTESAVGSVIIVGTVDFRTLVGGLFELYAPNGVTVSISGRFAAPNGAGVERSILQSGDIEQLHTVPVRTVSAGAELLISWHFSSAFSGGPKTKLANVFVLFGISMTILTGLLTGILWSQNHLVKKRIEAATADLKDKENQIRSLFETSNEGIWMIDNDGLTTEINESLSKILDQKPEEVVGKYLHDFLDEDSKSVFLEQLERRKAGQSTSYKVTIERPNGEKVPVVINGTPLYDIEGVKIGSFGMVTDITEIEEAQRDAKLLKEAMDTFTDMVILYDKDERVIFTNDRYHEIYPNSPPKDEIKRYTMESLLRRSLDAGQISHPLAKKDPEEWLRGALDARRNPEGSTGETIHSSGRTFMFRYERTTEGGLILMQTDITDRKHMEQEIAYGAEKLKTTIENIPAGVMMCDAEGRVQIFNELFCDLFEFPDELVSEGSDITNAWRYQYQRGDYGFDKCEDDAIKDIWAFLQIDDPVFYKRKTPSGKMLDLRVSPLPSGGGVWIATDSTKREQLLRAIRESEAQLLEILENSPIAVAVSRDDGSADDGVIEFWNSRFRSILEIEESEPGNARTSDFFQADKERRDHETKLDEGESLFDLDNTWISRTGRKVSTLMSLSPIRFNDRKSALIWLYDISELKRVQREVAEKEALLRLAMENMPGAMQLVDNELRIVSVNQKYIEFYGDPDGLLKPGTKMSDVLRSEVARGMLQGTGTAEEILEQRLASFKPDKPVYFEDTSIDGRHLQLTRNAAPDGFTVSVAVDVTELKEAEREVDARRAQLDGILRNIHQGVVLCDSEQRLVAWNDQWPSIVNIDPQVLMPGVTIYEVVLQLARQGNYGDAEPESLARERTDQLWGGDVTKYLSFGDEKIYEVKSRRLMNGGLIATYNDITDLKNTERQLKSAIGQVNASIQYASNIQRSVLPDLGMFDEHLEDYFIIWEPRDIVGGDIYWCHQWGDGFLIVLADCTGHGVPGAFMTLIATGALDRAIESVDPGRTGLLIQRMHQHIQLSLGQHTEQGESDDGLELGVVYINAKNDSLIFSGARFDFYTYDADILTVTKGTKRGVGYRGISFDQEYEEVAFSLTSGNRHYMTSDGLIDQVGGEKRRSFGKKKFRELLSEIKDLPMEAQKLRLKEALIQYQGNERRRDDVSVIGFKIS